MTKSKTNVEDTINKTMAAMAKMRRKISRADLDFTVQISSNSADPNTISYAAQLTAPATDLAPVTFISKDPDDLLERIKVFTKNVDYQSVEVAYHEAQIESCKRTITGHEERIAELKNPPAEEESSSEQNEPNTDNEQSEQVEKHE